MSYKLFQLLRFALCLHLNRYSLVIFSVHLFHFVDWFSQQNDFHTNIEDMEEELNECLRKF